jgi:hypothetical protein
MTAVVNKVAINREGRSKTAGWRQSTAGVVSRAWRAERLLKAPVFIETDAQGGDDRFLRAALIT